ncbi:pepsin/retropepsin-like aspartic protease family protein [Paenimyroides baculatum]|uniref:Clan AA aspartic protease n=1 Tax=Paenimyroides baculatum TaxID=2608000 RepID=A0A5M6CRC5_9FLAO|nr:aspartyl protease family protein [Paenimyroides baculatum]KAA5537821.1 clan AA aspartic protease [Paenimyroides baculatum]
MTNKIYKKGPVLLCLLVWLNAPAQVVADTLKMGINDHNTIYVTTVFNKKDTLTLNFDTGCTDLILTTDVLKNKLYDSVKLYNTDYSLEIGQSVFFTRVYDAQLTGHGTEGRFGWNFFTDKTVELNYDSGIMVVHNELPNEVLKNDTYTRLPFKIMEGIPFIEAEIIQNDKSLKDYFLFDTGYQRTAMLDNEELLKNGFPEMKELNRVMMRGGQGNEVPVITSELQVLKIGTFKLENVPVQQITGNKPMKNRNAHILGNEVLKRFNVFMDYKNGFVYLKPNHLFNMDYIETKKS